MSKYLPTIGRSFSRVAAGTTSGRVIIAVASARAHSQSRAIGRRSTALAMTCCAICAFCVRLRDDHLDGDRVVVGMPAVVVGHERHGRVADLRFARELRLLQVGHADDVEARRAVEVATRRASKTAAPPCRRTCRRDARSRPRARRAAYATWPSGPQNGWANATCATSPSPKNVLIRPRVRSKNWSGITRSSGAYVLAQAADGARRQDPLHAEPS